MTFLDWIGVGQAVTGIVGSLIKQHERPGNGEHKKTAVVEQTVEIVGAALGAIGSHADLFTKQTIREMASKVVDEQVEFANNVGDFAPSVPEPPAQDIKVEKATQPLFEENELAEGVEKSVEATVEVLKNPPAKPMTLVSLATRFVGIKELSGEKDHPLIQWWMSLCGYPLAVHDEVPWCSGFLNGLAWELDLPRSSSAASRSWLHVGYTVLDLKSAISGWDIIVLKKSGGPGPETLQAPGHVGIFIGTSTKAGQQMVHLLGGNQSNQVSIAEYPASLIIGIRRLWA